MVISALVPGGAREENTPNDNVLPGVEGFASWRAERGHLMLLFLSVVRFLEITASRIGRSHSKSYVCWIDKHHIAPNIWDS